MAEQSDTKSKTKPRTPQKRKIIDRFSIATQYELDDLRKQSKTWFSSEAKDLANTTKLTGNITLSPKPGEMYMFHYLPKHKDTLPFYDRFPLVFPFTILPDGFIGINFHYLHYKDRIMLLSALEEIAYSPRKETSSVLRLSYQVLKSVAKKTQYEKCIHRYLTTHLKSPLRKIHSDKWIVATMLPFEAFMGQKAEYVWRQK